MVTTAVYPGTFDPITNGHSDLIKKAIMIFDKLIIAVAHDVGEKNTLFSTAQRVELAKKVIANEIAVDGKKEIIVVPFSGLLVKFVKESGSSIIIRGLRAVSDFEYELQMSAMNAKVESSIQTIFIPAGERSQFVASRFVREIYKLGGDVSKFVNPEVEKALRIKLASSSS
jgi:pantetheine-phosphate adenylyltransferase